MEANSHTPANSIYQPKASPPEPDSLSTWDIFREEFASTGRLLTLLGIVLYTMFAPAPPGPTNMFKLGALVGTMGFLSRSWLNRLTAFAQVTLLGILGWGWHQILLDLAISR